VTEKIETLRTAWYGLHFPLAPALASGGTQFIVGEDGEAAGRFGACVASAVAAERSGAHVVLFADATDWYCPGSVWNGELSDLLDGAPDPHGVFTTEPIIAAAGALTSEIEFMWGPVDVVRRAPINIAQMVLTLDHATKGRMSVVLGQGQIDHMRQTGISRIGTKDKLWDGVQIVRKLIRQTEPFSFRGRVWKFDRGALATPYYGDTPPDVLVAGGMDETLELVGRHADGWMTAIPGGTHDEFAQQVRAIRRYAEHAGRDPDSIRIAAYTSCFMAEDSDLLEEALDHPLAKWNSFINAPAPRHERAGFGHPYGGNYNYMTHTVPEWFSREDFYDVTAAIHRDGSKTFSFYGNADQVLEQLEPFLALGVTDVMIANTAGMAGSRFAPSCYASDQKLAAGLLGRPVVRSGTR
jgi:phthiodiolone/phenolphthiodiolone dimycocerosates ketoreductase